jgi:hypothetical protein
MRSSMSRAFAVAVVAAFGATGAMSGLAAENPANRGIVVVAEFASAGPLLTGNEVKVDGVVVGSVGDTVVDGDHADVLLELDPAAMPLYRDARATIRPISLLGERYVDLERGTPGTAEMADGGTIPRERTATNVDLDEILNTIDEPTGESLAFLVTTLGDGLRDNGGNVDAALRALTPALRDTEGLTSVLEDQNALLGSLPSSVSSRLRISALTSSRVGSSSAARTVSSSTGAGWAPVIMPPDGISALDAGPSVRLTSRSPSSAFQITVTVAPSCSGANSRSRTRVRRARPSTTSRASMRPASKPLTLTRLPSMRLAALSRTTSTR